MTHKLVCIVVAAVLCMALFSSRVRAQGQGVYGAITGALTDPSGAAVPGATVTATNIATGVKTTTKTDNAGYYTVVALIAGNYNVEVSLTGFKTSIKPNVPVRIDSTVTLDLQLEVGSINQQVTVTGAPPLLQSEKVEVTNTVTSQQISDIPSVHNNIMALFQLTPGFMVTVGQTGLPSAGSDGVLYASVNGAVNRQNAQYVDGTMDSDPVSSGPGVVPPKDALESVVLDTTNYDVEYGQSQGSVTLMTTKSGTNRWHGTAYESNQVNAYSGRNPFTEPLHTSHYVWNQFGGTIGGPIKKDKLFVFGGYQRTPYRSAANTLTTVPTAAFRVGNFSSVPQYPIFDPSSTTNTDGTGRTQFQYGGTLNIIPPNEISPIATNLINLLPLPNNGTGTVNNFLAPLGTLINANDAYGRVDYQINSTNRLFGRYTHNWQNSGCEGLSAFGNGTAGADPVLALGSCQVAVGSDDLISGDFVHVFSPTLVLEGRFGWFVSRNTSNAFDSNSSPSTAAGLTGLNGACSVCGGLAAFIIGGPTGATTFGNLGSTGTTVNSVTNEEYFTYSGIGTWTHGSHTVKFGGMIDFANDHSRGNAPLGMFGCANAQTCSGTGFTQTITGAAGVANSGLGMATFLLGDAAVFGRVIYAFPLSKANQKRDDVYISDTWRITPKFTAVLGLRYDYIGFPTSPIKGNIANFDFTNTDTIVANYGNVGPTAGVRENWFNFGPRVGLAYKITPKTVIRTGYGKSYPVGWNGANFRAYTNDWPTATRQDVEQTVSTYVPAVTFAGGVPPFVSGFALLAAAGNPGEYPTPNSEGFGADPRNPTNSIDFWNFTVQHQFGNDTTLTTAYVGNAGRHFFYRVNYNAALPGPSTCPAGTSPGPTCGTIAQREPYYAKYNYTAIAFDQSNQGSAGYAGLQTSLEKRFSAGYTLTAAVTWSRAYDFNLDANASQYPWDSNLDRGAKAGERALVITVGHVWNLPFGSGQKFLANDGAVVNHIVSGWKFSGITNWMSGDPLTVIESNTASLNSNCCTLRPNRIASGILSSRTVQKWFDPSAFVTPPAYTYGNSARSILRGPSYFEPDWSLSRSFKIKEDKRLEFQWQVFDCFNRMNLADPTLDISSVLVGRITNIASPVRTMELGLHLYW